MRAASSSCGDAVFRAQRTQIAYGGKRPPELPTRCHTYRLGFLGAVSAAQYAKQIEGMRQGSPRPWLRSSAILRKLGLSRASLDPVGT